MSEIKGIIFDLGGVITHGGGTTTTCRLAGEDFSVSADKVAVAIERVGYGPEMDQETGVQFWRKVCKEAGGHCLDESAMASLWSRAYQSSVVDESMLEFVDGLRAQYKVGMLSNTVPEHVVINKKRDIFPHFDDIVLSCEVGLRKPDPAIYKLAAERLNIPPDQLVFVDDLEINVEAANRLGMHGIVFKDLDQLTKELAQLGVLT